VAEAARPPRRSAPGHDILLSEEGIPWTIRQGGAAHVQAANLEVKQGDRGARLD
jgi:hypothetical protein